MQDSGYTFANARRHSNSSSQGLTEFQTKFETTEPEPVFQEQLHGPTDTMVDEATVTKAGNTSSNGSMTDQEAPGL